MLHSPRTKPFTEISDVAIGMRLITKEQPHIGIIYHIPPDAPLNLNLREHLDLRNEPPTESYCWAQIELHEVNRRVLAAFCALIAKKCKNVPYGFTYNGLYFAPTGDYIPRDLGHGLTCATFVMAMFETQSLRVLKEEEWPTADLEDSGLCVPKTLSGLVERRIS